MADEPECVCILIEVWTVLYGAVSYIYIPVGGGERQRQGGKISERRKGFTVRDSAESNPCLFITIVTFPKERKDREQTLACSSGAWQRSLDRVEFESSLAV